MEAAWSSMSPNARAQSSAKPSGTWRGCCRAAPPGEHRGFQRDPHVWVLGIWDMATRDLEEGWESLLGSAGDAQDEGDGTWGGRGGRVPVQTVCISTKKLKIIIKKKS